MSHLMVLFGTDDCRVAELNLSRAALDALTALGLDLYALYDASEHDAGVSGDGEDVQISAEIARQAYIAVRGWTVALNEVLAVSTNRETAPHAANAQDASLQAESRARKGEYLQRFSEMALHARDPRVVAVADRCEDLQQFARDVYESARQGCATILFG